MGWVLKNPSPVLAAAVVAFVTLLPFFHRASRSDRQTAQPSGISSSSFPFIGVSMKSSFASVLFLA